MAIIFEFPTEKQRARAAIETHMKSLLDNVGVMSAVEKENHLLMVMSTWDEYSKWNIRGSVTQPDAQPFTDDQVEAIKAGMRSMDDEYKKQISKMFVDILTLKHQLYILTGTSP